MLAGRLKAVRRGCAADQVPPKAHHVPLQVCCMSQSIGQRLPGDRTSAVGGEEHRWIGDVPTCRWPARNQQARPGNAGCPIGYRSAQRRVWEDFDMSAESRPIALITGLEVARSLLSYPLTTSGGPRYLSEGRRLSELRRGPRKWRGAVMNRVSEWATACFPCR